MVRVETNLYWLLPLYQNIYVMRFYIYSSVSMASREAPEASSASNLEVGSAGSLWIQLTIPSLAWDFIHQECKISLAVEDSSMSFDRQQNFNKFSLRIRNIRSRCERLTEGGSWVADMCKGLDIACNKPLFPQLVLRNTEELTESRYTIHITIIWSYFLCIYLQSYKQHALVKGDET